MSADVMASFAMTIRSAYAMASSFTVGKGFIYQTE